MRPPLFTPTEAAVLTGLPVKAVNNAIDKKTVPAVAGTRAGHATRLLDLRALMSLTLERRLADRFVPELRREVFEALAKRAAQQGVARRRLPEYRPARAAAGAGDLAARVAPRA